MGFAAALKWLDGISSQSPMTLALNWMPALGLRAVISVDQLSCSFVLLVTGIGALVLLYSSKYLEKDPHALRFYIALMAFMSAMILLVMAGDIITLFIAWEMTTLTSFFLVAHKTKDPAARKGSLLSLFMTGSGGIFLLAGLLVLSGLSGSTEFAAILGNGANIVTDSRYPLILGLIGIGVFTKSAQVPFHIWLPQAMTAPTPASAYLHSATMVKAGIYLLARLHPALGGTETWFWVLTIIGTLTMVTGAVVGILQKDLKALLAYSTISQLGVLTLLLAQDTSAAFKAAIIGIIAHALYKSALFMVVGIIDHETGTRDIQRLGGLRKSMPITTGFAICASLSLAGLPPLFGFLAKETLLATVTHPSLPFEGMVVLTFLVMISAAALFTQAGIFIFEVFWGTAEKLDKTPHEAPWPMWLAAAIPAVLSILFGLLPEPLKLASFIAGAAESAYGAPVKVSLALWQGLNPPLVLSLIAISLGIAMVLDRRRIRLFLRRSMGSISWLNLYLPLDKGLRHLMTLCTHIQHGRLRSYLFVMLSVLCLLVWRYSQGTYSWEISWALPAMIKDWIRLAALTICVASTAVAIGMRKDASAILTLGVSGLMIAIYIALEPAPDVAMVQLLVDVLIVVITVLVLKYQPKEVEDPNPRQQFPLAPTVFGILGGIGMTLLTYEALNSRPRTSQVTPFFEESAKPLTGAADIVGAIVVDFRRIDTWMEISVFCLAGLALFGLANRWRDLFCVKPPTALVKPVLLVGMVKRVSPLIKLFAFEMFPAVLILAFIHIIYGHNRPGDGFTAGIILSICLGLTSIFLGYDYAQRRIRWMRPVLLAGTGFLLALIGAFLPLAAGLPLMSPFNFGDRLGLSLPKGVYLSTSFLFEVAVCLVICGGAVFMIQAWVGIPPAGKKSESAK